MVKLILPPTLALPTGAAWWLTHAKPVAPLPAPPYGGLGLARAGELPPTDPATLGKQTERMPQFRAATASLLQRAGDLQRSLEPRLRASGGGLLQSASGALSRLREMKHLPRVLYPAAALLLVCIYLWNRGDAVERLVARGDLKAARAEVKQMVPGPARSFDEGIIEQSRGSFESAAGSYQSAARGGDRRGYRRLLKMTEDPRCAARASAAQALGRLGDKGAISALRSLGKATFPDEGDDTALGSLFGCSSHRAARAALESLGDD